MLVIDWWIGPLNHPTSNVQASDSVVRAANTRPLLAAGIAIEPVGVVSPVGAIGGRVKVHESLSCQRVIDKSTASTHESLLRWPSTEPRAHTACRAAYVALTVRSHTASAAKSQRAPNTAVAAACQGRRPMGRVRGGCEVMVGHGAHTRRETRGGGARARAGKRTTTRARPQLSDSLNNQPNQPRSGFFSRL